MRLILLTALVFVLSAWGETSKRPPIKWQKDLVFSLDIPLGGRMLFNTERKQLYTFGTATNIATNSTKGSVLRFGGTTANFVTIEKSTWFNVETSPITIEILIRFNENSQNRYYFSDHNAALNNACIGACDKLGTGQCRYWYNRAGVEAVVSTTSQANTIGQWYHLMFTRAGNTGAWTLKAYFNGKLEGTVSTANNPATASNAGTPTIGRVGSYSSGSFNLNGDVKYCNIWQRALSETEVLQRYKETLNRK